MSSIIIGNKINCSTDLLDPVDISPLQCIGNSLDIINSNYDLLRENDGLICSSLTDVVTAVESIVTPPVGSIIMWSGDIKKPDGSSANYTDVVANAELYIDDNWALCTGATVSGVHTPNLIGRFIVGAGEVSNTTTWNSNQGYYELNETGGTELHRLTQAELPADAGSGDITVVVGDTHGGWINGTVIGDKPGPGWRYYIRSLDVQTLSIGRSGGGEKHENRPPYYALYFIIRIS